MTFQFRLSEVLRQNRDIMSQYVFLCRGGYTVALGSSVAISLLVYWVFTVYLFIVHVWSVDVSTFVCV